jgi:hypothetical protein
MSKFAKGEITLDRLTIPYHEDLSRNGKLIPIIPDGLTEAELTQLRLELEKNEETLRKGRAHYARLFGQEILLRHEINSFLGLDE